jgi:hypothetical protein
MNEDEFDLTPDQWETLKALRAPVTSWSSKSHVGLDHLLALGLVTIRDQLPVITPNGRRALIRGSFRLWDAAA